MYKGTSKIFLLRQGNGRQRRRGPMYESMSERLSASSEMASVRRRRHAPVYKGTYKSLSA